jgi:DNA-binding response OmpR family regulator
VANILAIDDDEQILRVIKKALEAQDHSVTAVSQPVMLEAYKYYDLILLDVMMPEIDGFTLCKQIRTSADCPIVFLTAKAMEQDIITGLSVGADDYLSKPFGIAELRARVAAHLRREHRQKQNAFSISGLQFNLLAKEVYFQQAAIPFTKSEYGICEFLALNHGQVFSKEQVYEKVFGYDGESDSSAIVEHIKNIRSKLSKVEIAPIETVWGIGYKWKT